MQQPNKSPVQEHPSDEAKASHLPLAQEQGQALQRALDAMEKMDTHGKPQQAGDYLVNYAVEKAEGLYHLVNGQLEWQEPQENNAHLEVMVRDAGDGRFIPGLTVIATLYEADGKEIDNRQLPFLWHPWLYHYGQNFKVPGDGEYSLKVRIEVPDFPRHDKENGKRYLEPVEIEFKNVKIKTGQK
jgi:hypothetical protein